MLNTNIVIEIFTHAWEQYMEKFCKLFENFGELIAHTWSVYMNEMSLDTRPVYQGSHQFMFMRGINFFGLGTQVYRCAKCGYVIEYGHQTAQHEVVIFKDCAAYGHHLNGFPPESLWEGCVSVESRQCKFQSRHNVLVTHQVSDEQYISLFSGPMTLKAIREFQMALLGDHDPDVPGSEYQFSESRDNYFSPITGLIVGSSPINPARYQGKPIIGVVGQCFLVQMESSDERDGIVMIDAVLDIHCHKPPKLSVGFPHSLPNGALEPGGWWSCSITWAPTVPAGLVVFDPHVVRTSNSPKQDHYVVSGHFIADCPANCLRELSVEQAGNTAFDMENWVLPVGPVAIEVRERGKHKYANELYKALLYNEYVENISLEFGQWQHVIFPPRSGNFGPFADYVGKWGKINCGFEFYGHKTIPIIESPNTSDRWVRSHPDETRRQFGGAHCRPMLASFTVSRDHQIRHQVFPPSSLVGPTVNPSASNIWLPDSPKAPRFLCGFPVVTREIYHRIDKDCSCLTGPLNSLCARGWKTDSLLNAGVTKGQAATLRKKYGRVAKPTRFVKTDAVLIVVLESTNGISTVTWFKTGKDGSYEPSDRKVRIPECLCIVPTGWWYEKVGSQSRLGEYVTIGHPTSGWVLGIPG
jgi:hypothetical protein